MDKSASILIVDDYLLIRTSVRSVLAELGFFNVYQADNGKTAQDLMRKQPIDVVIGDWNMPVMSGIELLKWMRQDERYSKVPFMMLTAENNPGSVRTALQSGVNAYMIKPFTVHSFSTKFLSMTGPLKDAPVPSATIDDVDEVARLSRAQVVKPGVVAPAAPAAAEPAPAAAPAATDVIGLDQPIEEKLKKCTVLVVDDVPNNIEVIAGTLKDDYSIKVAISGRKAIEIAQAFHIDLILLDIMMPNMDGFETCRLLKADPATADIPVIFLTARDSVDDVVAGLRLGAVDYVAKPADPTILKARLSAHLTLSMVMKDLKRQNELLVENAHLREDVERMTQHDLKNPIAVALQGTQALKDSKLSDKQREHVEMIETAATDALSLINRTLDVYKMETGEYQPTLVPFDLGEVLVKCAQQTEATFRSKNIRFEFPNGRASDGLGEPILCYSMFTNLMKNAAEASPMDGKVIVDIAPGYGCVHVVIDNLGEVPASMRSRFFDKYSSAEKEGGTGLGTYSVRLMAEVQGGDVTMESGDGHTRLTVTLPNA
ncbi:response regulator [Massilia arenosa]|uniref:histidine kinase n=1 Tax=Zemynaea arenosa TaxID=2561931 RepID=A0A4Y9SJB3_9BURK|nr:response regulator [Massilia arenosa]TFW25518.1 response regulator [Massilia arenosa]